MRAANVTWKGISLHDVKEMDFAPEEFETYALRRGDLLLSEASGSASEVGKPAVWNDEVPDCCFQNTLIRVRAPEPLVPFLHLHFYKDALTGAFAKAARGVGIHHLGAKTLAEWVVHVPPLDEQRRIVETVDSYFTRLDQVTATLERVRRSLKRYRASILKAAVEGRLVPTEAELARAEGRGLRARFCPAAADPRPTASAVGGSRVGEDEGGGEGAEERQVEGEVQGAGRTAHRHLTAAAGRVVLGDRRSAFSTGPERLFQEAIPSRPSSNSSDQRNSAHGY